jgi:hypothetical protein
VAGIERILALITAACIDPKQPRTHIHIGETGAPVLSARAGFVISVLLRLVHVTV